MNSDIALEVKNIYISYRTIKKLSFKSLFFFKGQKQETKQVIENINFHVKKGEILGIIGKNGSGKSTLLRAIAGIISLDKGEIDTKHNRVSLLALRIGFNEELTGYDNIFLSGMLLGINKKIINERIDEVIEFSELKEDIYKQLKTYSSGMKLKLAFSISVIFEPDIILIDEVLSVGDIKFKEKSYNKMKELIMDENKTVLIVSHDLNILSELCDNVIWIDNKKIKKIGKAKEVIEDYKNYNLNMNN